MSLKIKQGNIIDLPEIVRLNTRIFEGMYETSPYSFEQYQNKIRNINPFILLARDENTLVGDSISFERDGNWYIWILGVDPKFRKQGIATSLLELNEKHANILGLKNVTVKVYNTSPDMQKLLASRNYAITNVEPSKSSHKYDAVHYCLKLF